MANKMTEGEISLRLLQQRIRNRIIEYLELAASEADQRDYERRVPVSVPNEMINQWEDWVRADDLAWYGPPIFSRDEHDAICAFQETWSRVADETPDPIPGSIEAFIGTPPWDRLVVAAKSALAIFGKRGRFDEAIERVFSEETEPVRSGEGRSNEPEHP